VRTQRAEEIPRAREQIARRAQGERTMRRAAACSAVFTVILTMLASASFARADAPWWHVRANSLPSALTPGGKGTLVVSVSNIGDAAVLGVKTPVRITDSLPAGVTVTGIAQTNPGMIGNRGSIDCEEAFPATSVTCTWSGSTGPEPSEFEVLQPYEALEVTFETSFSGGSGSEENDVTVSGGEGYACKEVNAGFGSFSGPACGPLERVAGGSYAAAATEQPVPPSSSHRVLPVSSGAPSFGAEEYAISAEDEGGEADTRAGSHPYQVTATFAPDQAAAYDKPIALPRNLHFALPAGLIGNPVPIPQCTEVEFSTIVTGFAANRCPNNTVVGVVMLSMVLYGSTTPTKVDAPLFNLTPARGEAARFGFEILHVAVMMGATVRSGSDYGVVLNVDDITQLASIVSAQVTVWGTPGLASHDKTRGWSCVDAGEMNLLNGGTMGPCVGAGETEPQPFLRMPTSCSGPLSSTVTGESWPLGEPKQTLSLAGVNEASLPGMEGCAGVPFAPEISFEPDVHAASSATGATVKVRVPQEAGLDPNGVSPADIKDTEVTLPQGVALNPAAANGLEACSESLVGFTGFDELNRAFEPGVGTAIFTGKLPEQLEPGVNFCPEASKIGTVKIKTPPLANPLEGALYLADQTQNPFGSLVAMYVVVEDPVSGVQARLAGEVTLEEQHAGRIVARFENTPQVPLEELEIHLFEGELVTPSLCRRPGEEDYETAATFAPWSGAASQQSTSGFYVTSGPNGGPCPNPSGDRSLSALPFDPSLNAGTTSAQAAGFSPLTTTISREDGDQSLSTVTLHMPAGLAASLTGVELCPDAQASAGTCGPDSLIGHATATAGVGDHPYTVAGGKVFLTVGYDGAPFGLSITSPAKAGPYDLAAGSPCDCIVVRAKIEIDPHTAAVTAATDPLPHSLDGIPLALRQVNVILDRPDFTFNPSNCDAAALSGEITSTEGAATAQSVPFKVVNCALLKFTPKLTVSTKARPSKALGASLTTELTVPSAAAGTQANIAAVKVDLPKQLPSELRTLQQACLAAVFDANPAKCPPHSIVGHATVNTPILPVPLTGPAYFVSHGGEEFPSLTMVLQGYGITIDLVGATRIHKGVTSTTFRAVPDVPFSSFELSLPQGGYSALGANLPAKAKGSFCGQNMHMLVAFVAQNGAELHEAVPIDVTGCAARRKAKTERGY
jgi:uncharacterized repeat protein (TIGR01451 family)